MQRRALFGGLAALLGRRAAPVVAGADGGGLDGRLQFAVQDTDLRALVAQIQHATTVTVDGVIFPRAGNGRHMRVSSGLLDRASELHREEEISAEEWRGLSERPAQYAEELAYCQQLAARRGSAVSRDPQLRRWLTAMSRRPPFALGRALDGPLVRPASVQDQPGLQRASSACSAIAVSVPGSPDLAACSSSSTTPGVITPLKISEPTSADSTVSSACTRASSDSSVISSSMVGLDNPMVEASGAGPQRTSPDAGLCPVRNLRPLAQMRASAAA